MKLFKLFTTLTVLFFLGGCGDRMLGPTGIPSSGDFLGNYGPGQWDYPEDAGKDKYIIRGWGTREALRGARYDCEANGHRKGGKSIEVIDLNPGGRGSMAVIIYKCVKKNE